MTFLDIETYIWVLFFVLGFSPIVLGFFAFIFRSITRFIR